jgi:hypothetical protein
MDAIAEPIGGATNPAMWDEDKQVFVLNPAWIAEQMRGSARIITTTERRAR